MTARGHGAVKAIRDWSSLLLSLIALTAGGAALYADRAAAVQDAPIKERLAAVEAKLGMVETQLNRIANHLMPTKQSNDASER